MHHSEIISKLGVRPLAAALDLKYPSQVQGWKQRDSIPLKYIQKIIDYARSQRIKLTVQDFL